MKGEKKNSLERRLQYEIREAERADSQERERHVVRYMTLDRKYVEITKKHYIPHERLAINALLVASLLYISGCASFIKEITRPITPGEQEFYERVMREREAQKWQWFEEERKRMLR